MPKRRWVRIALAVLLVVLGVAGYRVGQRLAMMPDPEAPLTVMPLRGGAYWIKGGVSNTGFVVGKTGVIVIDPQMFAATARNAQAAIAGVTDQPVRHLIVTHSDPDHVNGLPGWPQGIEVHAHANARDDIAEGLARWMPSFIKPPRAVAGYLPKHPVKDRFDLQIDGVRLVLLHFGPAHTDGDLIVYVPDLKLVYAGDILAPEIGPYPGIHLEKNGSSLGWMAFVREMLKLDADIYVSGHGQTMTQAEVRTLFANAEKRRAEIADLVGKGESLAEIKATLRDVPLNGVASIFPTFVETTYEELTTAPPPRTVPDKAGEQR